MVNHVGTRLARLISSRAYQAGELTRIDRELGEAFGKRDRIRDEIRRLTEKLGEAEQALNVLQERASNKQAEIAELDRQIAADAPIDPSKIRAIRRTPRLGHFRHGELTSYLVDLLREAGGPLPTSFLVNKTAERFGIPIATSAELREAVYRVRCPLKVMAAKGAILRLHERTSRNQEQLWVWAGAYDA